MLPTKLEVTCIIPFEHDACFGCIKDLHISTHGRWNTISSLQSEFHSLQIFKLFWNVYCGLKETLFPRPKPIYAWKILSPFFWYKIILLSQGSCFCFRFVSSFIETRKQEFTLLDALFSLVAWQCFIDFLHLIRSNLESRHIVLDFRI